MEKYHKIQTVFNRNPDTKFRTVLEGQFQLPEFEYLQNNNWIFTEKVDGTNIRVIWNCEKVTFGGKSDNAQIPALLITKLQDLFPIEKFKEHFLETPVCLYGEGFGARIQKGGGNYISNGVSFILFDIKVGEWWLKQEDVQQIGNKLDIQIVPVIGKGTLHDMVKMAKEGFKSQWGDFLAEGIVSRPEIDLIARNGQRIITKIKHKDF